MLLDLIAIIIIVLAIIQGYRKGLIVGVFSFIALFIGLAAAIKLSAVVAGYIGKTVKISEQWLPLIAFLIVFLVVVLLVRLLAKLIERTIQFAMLGWLNRLGGIVLYVSLYIIVLSVVLFYAEQIKIIHTETVEKSLTYKYIQPWGPKAINAMGSVLPVFKNMFLELEEFFGNLSHNIS
jgi:membrane protein required for colicin V production